MKRRGVVRMRRRAPPVELAPGGMLGILDDRVDTTPGFGDMLELKFSTWLVASLRILRVDR